MTTARELHFEWLREHCELQILRAAASLARARGRDRRRRHAYFLERAAKLDQARRLQ